MMWLSDTKKREDNEDGDSDLESSVSSSASAIGEEVPIWVRGEQRWVSGITEQTTCRDVVQVLLQDEKNRGRALSSLDKYLITERWRGVEQPLEDTARILDIWNTWGTAQGEVKLSLRRGYHQYHHTHPPEGDCDGMFVTLGHRHHRPPSLARKSRCRSESSESAAAWKTVHPKRLNLLHSQYSSATATNEELLRLVLKQGEVIRKQLKKLRHSEHQIGFLEDKTHRARVKKHGSNYLLETYLKGLPEAVDPEADSSLAVDKNSDSGVMTEGDSEQSQNNNTKITRSVKTLQRLSPSSEEFGKDLKDDDTSSTVSEVTIREQLELYEKITKVNKRLLNEEEALLRLDSNLRKYEKNKDGMEEIGKALNKLRTDMTKSACEMQHNEIVLEEIMEKLESRRVYLDNLCRDIANEDKEYEMLQALLFGKAQQAPEYDSRRYRPAQFYQTKELLDTLV
nr:unnamed protein product [Callosobruchus chinensis]